MKAWSQEQGNNSHKPVIMNNSIENWVKDMVKNFTLEETHIAHTHVKKYSKWEVMKKIQIKPQQESNLHHYVEKQFKSLAILII